MKKSYGVKRCSEANTIDANWEKPFWREIEPAEIGLSRWPVQSEHLPKSEVKLQYDDHELYVIFRVQDQYVRAVTTQIHGEVWKDSCVGSWRLRTVDKYELPVPLQARFAMRSPNP